MVSVGIVIFIIVVTVAVLSLGIYIIWRTNKHDKQFQGTAKGMQSANNMLGSGGGEQGKPYVIPRPIQSRSNSRHASPTGDVSSSDDNGNLGSNGNWGSNGGAGFNDMLRQEQFALHSGNAQRDYETSLEGKAAHQAMLDKRQKDFNAAATANRLAQSDDSDLDLQVED